MRGSPTWSGWLTPPIPTKACSSLPPLSVTYKCSWLWRGFHCCGMASQGPTRCPEIKVMLSMLSLRRQSPHELTWLHVNEQDWSDACAEQVLQGLGWCSEDMGTASYPQGTRDIVSLREGQKGSVAHQQTVPEPWALARTQYICLQH